MPQQPDNNDPPSLQQVAEGRVAEIVARLDARRATRAAALERHPGPLSIRTELTRTPRALSLNAEAAPTGGAAAAQPAAVSSTQTAGYLLAVGDSWFDYPIHDVLTKLDDNYGYNIESSAHKGDPIEAMISRVGQLDKLGRCVDKIASLGAVPKAVLVSGGGDDIAGAEFGMLINNIDLLPIPGWNDQVIAGVIDTRIAAAYRLMFHSINALCQARFNRTFPILVHGYDYPVPDGRGFLGGWGPLPGPWLKPGFDEKLFSDLTATTQMMVQLIDRFNVMLANLAQEPGIGDVRYINLRGTLSNATANYKDFWANELHPTGGGLIGGGADGFGAVAAKFQAVLATLP